MIKKRLRMLKLRQSDYDEIRRHGEETYPHECCGALLGKFQDDARSVSGIVRCRNTRTDSPRNRYEIDPVEVARIQRDARARGLDIVGFYHSHPDHPAVWSETDLEDAYWLGCSYLITSVLNGNAEQTHSFVLAGGSVEEKSFVDEELVIEP
jgi:proteasome lid subunit RPN8/RPN11